ncbi:glycosyltransferase [Cohnella yongneupensis]|uniref:Glycosyltransferase n=1 Tax=Cohnella yongneupensis TaxID=425006 RepID=A0ABW0R326_9BACL
MNILIYNPAALYGGAMSILNRCIEDIAQDTVNRYWIVVAKEAEQAVRIDAPHIRYIEISRSYRKRFKWLYANLPSTIRDNGIDAVVSLENTCNLILKSTPQYVYLHQSLQFAPRSILTFKLVLKIKWLNGFLIERSCKKAAGVFVQTGWMRDAVIGEYRVNPNRVFVLPPKQARFEGGKVDDVLLDRLSELKRQGDYLGVCVASPDSYKRIETLIRFVADHNRTNADRPVSMLLTFSPGANGYAKKIEKLAADLLISEFILFAGRLSPVTMDKVYELADGAFCSSGVESLGLPLVEAMSRGLKLFAPDLPYVRDVCGNYAVTYRFDDEKSLLARFKEHRLEPSPAQSTYSGESFIKLMEKIQKNETGSVECAELV